MDAALTLCDVCDFFEVVDPFWKEAASSGKGIQVARILLSPQCVLN
jgi:hypothetical protein